MRARLHLLAVFLVLGLLGAACSSDGSSSGPDTARPDWVDDAVIYEIFVRQFSEEGTFDAITQRLPELEALGVNALWLMPFHPIGEEKRKGTVGSPYSIRDYVGIDAAHGSEGELAELVDALHERGMHIIIDWVANHTALDHPWTETHTDWYTLDESGQPTHPPDTDWTDVADLTYLDVDQRRAVADAMQYWVETFDIDGFRCDVAERVPDDFWEETIAELRSIKPLLLLAEGSRPTHTFGFDLSYPWQDYARLRAVYQGADVSFLTDSIFNQLRALPEGGEVIRYTTNHDETFNLGPPPELFDGLDGAEAAFVMMLASPGVPLLYAGQEVGSSVRTSLFEREPIVWDQNPEVRTFYTRLLGLFASSEALQEGELSFPLDDAVDVFVAERVAPSESLVVFVNARSTTSTVSLPAGIANETLQDAFSGASVALGSELVLSSYEWQILRRP